MGYPGLFTQDQLAMRFGMATATIEFYAREGLITPIRLNDSIFYTSAAFIRVEVIEKAKRLGFSIPEVKLLLDEAEQKKRSNLQPQSMGD